MMRYSEKANFHHNPTAKQLCYFAEEKQSNLILSLDVTTTADFFTILKKTSDTVCMVKTHIDILEDFSMEFVAELRDFARLEKFIIFEDRKFADIGNTVALQYSKGIYRIADWAQLVTGHAVAGPGLITGLKQEGLAKGNAMVLLAQMSARDNLLTSTYTEAAIEFAKAQRDFVIGFISLQRLLDTPEFLYMTPGVQLTAGKDVLGQNYLTPEEVIYHRKSDFMIVGRGIYADADPVARAKDYQKQGWQYYQQLLKQ